MSQTFYVTNRICHQNVSRFSYFLPPSLTTITCLHKPPQNLGQRFIFLPEARHQAFCYLQVCSWSVQASIGGGLCFATDFPDISILPSITMLIHIRGIRDQVLQYPYPNESGIVTWQDHKEQRTIHSAMAVNAQHYSLYRPSRPRTQLQGRKHIQPNQARTHPRFPVVAVVAGEWRVRVRECSNHDLPFRYALGRRWALGWHWLLPAVAKLVAVCLTDFLALLL